MAYISQETKAKVVPAIKEVLKKYGMKGSISVQNHMVLVVNVKSGKLDILENWFQKAREKGFINHHGDITKKPDYLQVNQYYINEHYTGEVKNFLIELVSAMKGNHWYDNSNIMIDYFDISYYLDVNIGKWNKPYVVNDTTGHASNG